MINEGRIVNDDEEYDTEDIIEIEGEEWKEKGVDDYTFLSGMRKGR